MKLEKKPPSKKKRPAHGPYRVYVCRDWRKDHCWHKNANGLRDRCCWCGSYR